MPEDRGSLKAHHLGFGVGKAEFAADGAVFDPKRPHLRGAARLHRSRTRLGHGYRFRGRRCDSPPPSARKRRKSALISLSSVPPWSAWAKEHGFPLRLASNNLRSAGLSGSNSCKAAMLTPTIAGNAAPGAASFAANWSRTQSWKADNLPSGIGPRGHGCIGGGGRAALWARAGRGQCRLLERRPAGGAGPRAGHALDQGGWRERAAARALLGALARARIRRR